MGNEQAIRTSKERKRNSDAHDDDVRFGQSPDRTLLSVLIAAFSRIKLAYQHALLYLPVPQKGKAD